MNYYYPYYTTIPMFSMARPTLFEALRNSIRSINFSGILNGTQKTLNIVNQAIPLVKQVSPVVKNAKTMFKVMNEFKKNDFPRKQSNHSINNSVKNNATYGEGPKFFV